MLDGATNIKKGTLILPTDLLNGKLLTIDNDKAIDIPAVKFLNPEGTKFTGVLVDIPEEIREYYKTYRKFKKISCADCCSYKCI